MRAFIQTSRCFRIPITKEEYAVIDHHERDAGSTEVLEMLEEIPGVSDVDYNAHFGMYIFLTVDNAFDYDSTFDAISKVIDREGNLSLYQIWGAENSWTMTTIDRVEKLKADGLIEADAILILEFPAETLAHANAVYNRLLKEYDE